VVRVVDLEAISVVDPCGASPCSGKIARADGEGVGRGADPIVELEQGVGARAATDVMKGALECWFTIAGPGGEQAVARGRDILPRLDRLELQSTIASVASWSART
jgi:hypothetical protein